MSGNALAIALALLRTPSMRTSLRQRPLPDDVGEMIELAAGEPGRVAMAAAGTGETPEQVLEAARFYVREVLLFPGADAYRVLGVDRAASPEQIKLHHRHLQHWLHPDRRGNDWESAFATRINAAWNELRSPARRAVHDARHAQAGMEGAPTFASHRVLVSSWRAAPSHGRRGLGWLALGAGVAGCVWLAVLVDRQANVPAPEWNAPEGNLTRDAASEDTTPPSPATSLDAALEHAGAVPQAAPAASEPAPEAPEVEASAIATAAAAPPAAVASDPTPPVPAPRKPVPAQARSAAYTAWVEDPAPAADSQASPAPSPAAPSIVAIDIAPALAAVAPPPPAVTPERERLARRCGSELTRYLTSDSGHVPPIWRSVAAQDAAASIRARLGGGRVRFDAPAWRIAADRASMTTTLRHAGSPAILRAEFAWRDGRWLVQHLQTESLP